jgi:hypothetical protein
MTIKDGYRSSTFALFRTKEVSIFNGECLHLPEILRQKTWAECGWKEKLGINGSWKVSIQLGLVPHLGT